MEVIQNSHFDHDFVNELKAFAETKVGVKGLVDSGLVKVPRIFIQRPENLPSSNNKNVTLSIPTIDFKGLNSDHRRREIVNQIREAAGTWGGFRIINHGIPVGVIDNAIEGVTKFHEQSQEVKKEFFTSDDRPVKFNTSANFTMRVAAGWRDAVTFTFRDQQFEEEAIPLVSRKAISEYIKYMIHLKDTLSELMSEALGLSKDLLASTCCMSSAMIGGNYYPVCPEPHLTLGAGAHSDPNFLTILAQDSVGGLQVLHQNQWVDVPYVTGSIIANIGDMMQIISNDKFKSIVHRVLSGPTARTSVACFFTPKSCKWESPYGPLKEILSDDYPPLYQHVCYAEYLNFYLKKKQPGARGFYHYKLILDQ